MVAIKRAINSLNKTVRPWPQRRRGFAISKLVRLPFSKRRRRPEYRVELDLAVETPLFANQFSEVVIGSVVLIGLEGLTELADLIEMVVPSWVAQGVIEMAGRIEDQVM